MSVSFPPLGGAGPAHGPAGARPAPGPAKSAFAEEFESASGVGQISPEIRAEVQAAARCAAKLHEQGRQLRFERDGESGRIRVEVRDLDGNVLRRVPPSEIFAFAAGTVTS